MKKFEVLCILFFGSLTVTAAELNSRTPARVSEVTINCAPPINFAGISARVSGKIKLSAMPNGASSGSGKLKIALLNPRAPWSGEKLVVGQYDDMTSYGRDRYFHGGAAITSGDDFMNIYVNFTRPDLSYVEYKEVIYNMICR